MVLGTDTEVHASHHGTLEAEVHQRGCEACWSLWDLRLRKAWTNSCRGAPWFGLAPKFSRALLERRRAALASQPRRHARSQAAGAARIKPWMIPDGCPTAFGCHGHHGCPCHCPSRVAYIVLYMLYTLYGAASRFSNISSRIEVGFPVHSPGKDSWLQDSVALELFQAKKPNMKNYSPKLTKQKIQSNNIKLYVYIYTRCFIFSSTGRSGIFLRSLRSWPWKRCDLQGPWTVDGDRAFHGFREIKKADFKQLGRIWATFKHLKILKYLEVS